MPGPIRGHQPVQTFLQNNPDKTLEVVNVSANPELAYSTDGVEVKADHWAAFTDQMPGLQEGDILRVRTREGNGNVSNWITLQASSGSSAPDTRNAQVYADAMGMEVNAQGGIDVVYLGAGMVSEPGAQLRMTNQRTGEHVDVILDDNGQLPPDTQLRGEAGDQFSLAVSDGIHNLDFSEVAGVAFVEGRPRVQIADPAVWAKRHLDSDGNPTVTTNFFTGPLFINEPTLEDVKQGSIANCYFASAAASMAMTDPEKIKEMIRTNEDGTYTVTFRQRDNQNRITEREVTIDGDLYVSSPGSTRPLYGANNGSERGADQIEMWYPLLEKAYATLKGNSYDNIGNGGNPGHVMSDMLGLRNVYKSIDDSSATRVWDSLQEAQDNKWPVTASTYGKDVPEAERYAGEKVYPWHVYSVLGVEEVNGEKFVKLRNPWGNTEPGYDGKDDGIFSLPLERFAHLYKGVNIGRK